MNRHIFPNVLYCLFLIMISSCLTANAQDTLRLYYHLDDPNLTIANKKKLDSLVYYRIIQDGKKITIVGYADYLGSTTYNINLSKKRAEYVRTHLTNIGVNTKNIILCEGKGEVPRDNEIPEGFAPDRRVDIVLNEPIPQPIEVIKPSVKAVEIKKDKNNIVAHQLKEVKVGETFVLNNIYFYPGRHTVRESSLETLGLLFNALEENDNINIRIEGHVCCIRPTAPDALDESTFELALSVNRAKAIYHYLIAEGIDKSRLEYVGFGKRRPAVAIEKTPEDADKNRRVEIRILSK